MNAENSHRRKRKISIRPAGLRHANPSQSPTGFQTSVLRLPVVASPDVSAQVDDPDANPPDSVDVQQQNRINPSEQNLDAEKKDDAPFDKGQISNRRRGNSRPRKPVGLYVLIVLMAAIIIACVFTIYLLLGSSETPAAKGEPQEEASSTATPKTVVTPEQQQMIDVALIKLREGDAESALQRFKLLKSDNPHIASLDYLTALAALQSGDMALASSSIEATIAKGERVSDALALSAAIEGMKSSGGGWQAMGDLKTRAEYYLRQAIEADTANPSPFVELAMRLRGRGDNDEARRMLEAARARINPVDSATILDTTLLLIHLQELPLDQLPTDLDPDKDTASLIGSSYIAMRRGDFATASGLLQTAQKRLPTDVYFYLLGDPELRAYATEPQLAPLFQ